MLIVDGTLFTNSFSADKKEFAEVIFEYLAYRKYNKQALILNSCWERIKERIKDDYQELYTYFKGFISPQTIMTENGDDEIENIIALANVAKTFNEKVIIISDKYDDDEKERIRTDTHDRVFIKDFEEINEYLRSKRDFHFYLWEKYYDSSA